MICPGQDARVLTMPRGIAGFLTPSRVRACLRVWARRLCPAAVRSCENARVSPHRRANFGLRLRFVPECVRGQTQAVPGCLM